MSVQLADLRRSERETPPMTGNGMGRTAGLGYMQQCCKLCAARASGRLVTRRRFGSKGCQRCVRTFACSIVIPSCRSLLSIASLPSATSCHPDRSSVIPLHRPRVYCEKSIYIDKFRNCAYLNDSDRNVIRTDRDVRKPTEKDQVNTQVSA